MDHYLFSYQSLKRLDFLNYLIKFSYDSTLLCPQRSTTTVEEAIADVTNWAVKNKMTVNLLKTVQIVFHRPNISQDMLPVPLKMSNVS